ncbi:MAG: lysophospholipid acyltransferase family protein [Phycisphaerales bacterium]
MWTHPPIYAGVRALAGALHLIGIDESIRIMRAMGGAVATLPINRKRLQRAKDNLAWCFPDWDESRVHRHAVEAYRHLFCLIAETTVAPRLLTEQGYPAFISWGDMKQAIDVLLRGQPCLLITGHAGNWELLGVTLSLLGFPTHALYRPLDMKPLDRWVQRSRTARGLMLVDKFGAAERLPPIVERGDPVGFIADQNAGERGLFVPFFDRLASAYKTIGVLAMRYQAPVVCGHAVRLTTSKTHRAGERIDAAAGPDDAARRRESDYDTQAFRYKVDIVDVIEPDDWADQPDPLFYITARYRRAIEQMVRNAPEQYLWMHRYWKSRPRHERDDKPFPARLRHKLEQLPWMDEGQLERIINRSEQDRAELRAARAFRPGAPADAADDEQDLEDSLDGSTEGAPRPTEPAIN